MSEVVNTIQPPEWMTKQFLEKKLRIGLQDEDIKIEHCKIEPAVAVGDNYASQMFRVTLHIRNGNVKSEKMSAVIKTLPPCALMMQFIEEAKIFQTETRMFVETLPDIHNLLEEACPGKYPKLHAETYYHQESPNNIIMLEDLCVSGFKLANRFEGLDLEHTLFVLESLGRFHASSHVLTKRKPSVIQEYHDYMFKPEFAHMFTKMLEGGVVALAEESESWTDFPKAYVEKLKNMKPVIMEKCFESYKRDDNCKINAIIHGDTWIANMMFKYIDNKVTAMKFVDYQLANYNSPALDVNYFIFTSPKQEIREQHLDMMLESYYKSFTKTLNELKYSIDYSLEEFRQEFFNRLFFGFVALLLIFPITCAAREDAADVEDMLDSSASDYKNKKLFRSPVFIDVMKRVLPFFEKHGII